MQRREWNIQQIMAWLSQRVPDCGHHDVKHLLALGRILDEHFRCEVLPGQKGLRTWAGIWLETDIQIRELWPAVEAVALKLDEFRTLRGKEVFALAGAAMLVS